MSDKQRVKLSKAAGRAVYGLLRFIIIFGLSFMNPADLLDNTVKLLPKHPSVYYWSEAMSQMFLPRSIINSFLLAFSIALIQTFTSTVVGYGLARFKFRGRGIAFAFVIVMLLVPYQVISIAQYQSFVNIKLFSLEIVDTFIPLYILAFTGLGVKEGLYIYLLRENFKALPQSLEEAAYIDGSGVFKTFLSIMLPNAKTIMITVFLFSFCWQWTDNTYSSLYLIDTRVLSNSVGQIIIRNAALVDHVGTNISRCAASLFVAAPLIGLFVLCQKFFVKSIAQAGLSNV